MEVSDEANGTAVLKGLSCWENVRTIFRRKGDESSVSVKQLDIQLKKEKENTTSFLTRSIELFEKSDVIMEIITNRLWTIYIIVEVHRQII